MQELKCEEIEQVSGGVFVLAVAGAFALGFSVGYAKASYEKWRDSMDATL